MSHIQKRKAVQLGSGMAWLMVQNLTSGIQEMAIETSQPLDRMDGDIDEAKPVQ